MSRVAAVRLLIVIAAGCLASALALRGAGTDQALFLAINSAAWSWLPAWAPSCLTILGNSLVATMLLAPTLLRTPNVLLAGLYATPVAMLLTHLPKAWVDSPRPAAVLDPASFHVSGMLLVGHNSLPSGHATTAFVVVAVVLLGATEKPPRWPATVPLALFGAAVALSRIAVGAHWPSDALSGAGVGLLAGLAGAEAQRRWPLGTWPGTRMLLALAVLACAAWLAGADLGYPLAWPLQIALAAVGAGAAAAVLWRGRAGWPLTPRRPG